MESKANKIEFYIGNYLDSENEPNEYYMYQDIVKFMQVLFKNRYQMKVWSDGITVVIEYNSIDSCFGEPTLEWVAPNEWIAKEGE